MVSSHSVPANLTILRWAREDAGLSLEEAADRANIKPLKPRGQKLGVTPAERLQSIEAGEQPLSSTLLKALAKAYRRPEITFFLPTPPHKEEFLVDFRTVDSKPNSADSPEFAALKRRIISLHKALKYIAEAEEEAPLAFVNSQTSNSSVSSVVAAIRSVLGPDPRKVSKIRNEAEFFKALRDQAQHAGIYVILLGDLGSHHSAISLEEFRGMCISDSLAPMIIINPNDTLKARVFSLLHEICHIFIGVTGYCNEDGMIKSHYDRAQETFCNAVAAEYLVPECELSEENIQEPLIQSIDKIAKKFKVSSIVIARRAKDINKITHTDYNYIVQKYIERARAFKNDMRGGPDANTVMAFHLGKKLVSALMNATSSGYIGFNDVSSLLGISVARLEKVAR